MVAPRLPGLSCCWHASLGRLLACLPASLPARLLCPPARPPTRYPLACMHRCGDLTASSLVVSRRESPPPLDVLLAQSALCNVAEFSAARMERTRFDELWLRVGAGAANLYCHQGGCEHLLSFLVSFSFPGAWVEV